jgi:hypothetical protein
MASTLAWYAGRCIKRAEHDKPALLEAAAQQVDGVWKPIENREALFKHIDGLELRTADARQVRAAEWLAFTMTPTGPRAKTWKALQHRRLYWYVDLSADGGQGPVHRRLLTKGFNTRQPSGVWIVRCTDDEVLMLDLKQQDGAAHLASGTSKVMAHRFDPASVAALPTAEGVIQLYDLNGAAVQATYDWTGDDAFALRLVRAAAGAGNVEANKFIPWLEAFAKQGQTLSSVDPSDLAFAHDAIRAGQLAKRLADDQALLRKFIDAFATDERIADVINAFAAKAAEQERQAARSRAETAFAKEIAVQRDKKLRELESDMRSIERARTAELDADRAQRLKQLSEAIERQRVSAEEELQRSVEARRAVIESGVQDLENRRAALTKQAAQLEAANEEAQRELASLLSAASEANAGLEATRSEANAIHVALLAEQASLTMLQMKCPAPSAPASAPTVSPVGLSQKIEASKLLSAQGKKLMMQFAALVLAGEVPALCGPGVSDFLAAAETMLAAGRAVRMEADPTIITFEDLWIRPGLSLPTALGHALRYAAGAASQPRTNLAVIERAERSGARFWYPPLLHAAQRGDVPQRLLMCVTIEDPGCEEAAAIFAHAVRLDVDGALAPNAGVAFAMAKAAGIAEELDPGPGRADVSLGAKDVLAHADALGASRTARALRVLAQARQMHVNAQATGTHASAQAAAFIRLFMTGGDAVDNTLRSLRHA